MCCRAVLYTDISYLLPVFDCDQGDLVFSPDYNIAPSQSVVTVRNEGKQRKCGLAYWGFTANYAKDDKLQSANARAETLATSNWFKHAFKQQRCLIVFDGYYEWKGEKGNKKPYYIVREDGKPMMMAGLWDYWGENRERLTCAVVTTTPNEQLKPIHHRMPAILEQGSASRWLDPETSNKVCQEQLVPSSQHFVLHPVSRMVNNPANQGSRLIAPM